MQQRHSSNVRGSGHSGHFSDTICRQFFQSPGKACALLGFILVLLLGTLVSTGLLDSIFLLDGSMVHKLSRRGQCLNHEITKKSRDRSEYPLNCSAGSKTNTSPGTYPTIYTAEDEDHNGPAPSICPDYFRWIHEDLRLWVHIGITREMIERGREPGHFRLVIVKGEAYVERLKKSFQSRDTFTLWGILQLLSRYPGQTPDLDLMFNCDDWLVVKKGDYSAPDAPAPIPLFRYCSGQQALDIVFLDFTFWG